MSKFTGIKCDECPDDYTWVDEGDEDGVLKLCPKCKEKHICESCEENAPDPRKCSICDETFCSACASLEWSEDENELACPECWEKYNKTEKEFSEFVIRQGYDPKTVDDDKELELRRNFNGEFLNR